MTDVVKIVEDIRETCLNKGQNGLLELCKKFDKLEGNSLIFNIPDNIEVDNDLKNAIQTAIENITKFHKAEAKKLAEFKEEKVETSKEIVCWRRFTPIENVGGLCAKYVVFQCFDEYNSGSNFWL